MKEFIKNEQVLNLVKKAMSTGFITYSEINNELPENFPADKISEMIEEMVQGAGDMQSRAAALRRTSAMLSEIIQEDRNHLDVIQQHGWQGTDQGKHSGNSGDEPEVKPVN